MAVINLMPKTKRVAVANKSVFPVGSQVFRYADLNPSLKRFNSFWDMMETVYIHGYTRAAMSVIGRSTIGAWWNLRKHKEFGKQARDIQRRRLYSFYMMFQNRSWNNIKDYQSFAFKLMIAVMYLKYFGQAAFSVVRNERGDPIGLDFLPGLVIPNVDNKGFFKRDEPAFVQYTSRNLQDRVDFKNSKDVIFISNPDWEGSPMGGSDVEALVAYALPLDLYLQSAASSYMQNRDMPEGVFILAADVSEEGFDTFVKEIGERYAGPTNLGRSPIVVQGEMDFKETRRLPTDLPYQAAREDTREEILAVTGAPGAKMGLTRDMANANLREMRREFHETSMIPIFRLVELSFYEQVHVREFGVLGWEFKFNNPDFLTLVERATMDMRYHQMGVYSPNEIRYEKGMEPREDEQGDMYYDQLFGDPIMPRGSPPEGREPEPDDPSQVGEPNTDEEPPERGDGHDDQTREDVLFGLRRWYSFAKGRIKRGRRIRTFDEPSIPDELQDLIQPYLDRATTVEDVRAIFTVVMREVYGGGYDSLGMYSL